MNAIMAIKLLCNLQAEFQRAFGRPSRDVPQLIPPKDMVFRDHLMREEVSEYVEAGVLQEDLVNVLDSLVDQLYILLGTINEHGLAEVMDKAFQEVHRSNMAKIWPDGTYRNDENGKTLKPKTWTPPNLESVLNEYMKSHDESGNKEG